MSWKWKLTLFICGLFAFLVFYSLTDSCNEYIVGKINESFKETPVEERRTSSLAGRHLFWSYFRGYTLGDNKAGYELYRDFLGVPKKALAAEQIFSDKKDAKMGSGKASKDWKQGWGILHPDAAEAFYDYICLMEPYESGVRTAMESKAYYAYMYNLHMKVSPDHLPHPDFMKFWPKIRQKVLNGRIGWEGLDNFDFNAKKAKPYVEPKP